MRIRNLFMLATAAMFALSACQNDEDLLGNNPGNEPEELEGEKTYAVFDIKVGEEGTRATTPGSAGEEAGIHNEGVIQTAGLYIFKWDTETSGTPEVMRDTLTAVQTLSGDWHIPAVALMLTSGKKHVIVVANMKESIKTQLSEAFARSTGYDEFYKLAANMSAAAASDNFDISMLFQEGDAKDATKPYILMSGEADPTLKAGVTQSEAEQESSTNPNHVKIYVDRLPAKIDVRLGYYNSASDQKVETELPVPEAGDKRVGTAKNFLYDVRNQNRQEYIMKHITGSFVNSIWSAPNTTVNTSRYFPIVTENLSFSSKLLNQYIDGKSVYPQAQGDDYREYVTYIPENTNETALRGNTSYVALKASYVPAEKCYVSGYHRDATANNKVTLTTATFPTPVTAGSYSLYNTDYNIAFKIEATPENAASEANLKALAGYHASRIANVLGDINIDDVMIANSTNVSGFKDNWSLKANNTALATATATRGKATLWVKVDKKQNSSKELEQIILTGVYYYNQNGAYVINEGINFGTLTCGLYTTDNVGLKCYYRVNIYDPALGITNMMYYSVVRNYSYHLCISKIKSIGYPTQIDLTINPDDPLTNNTFVLAHMIINQWTHKRMNNVEIGM